jgi:putative ABC transport system substrate-binding protein
MKDRSERKKAPLGICLIAFSICLSFAGGVRAQTKIPRLGYFHPATRSTSAPLTAAFLAALKNLGLIVGINVIVDYRYGEGKVESYPKLAKEIVLLQPDIIVAASTPIIEAVMRETKKIPIVMLAAADPVGSRLVGSLARPGGNVTGSSMRSPEVGGKRLELIKDILPKTRRVVIFWNPSNNSHLITLKYSKPIAAALDLELQAIVVQNPADFDTAFAHFLAIKADAFTVIRDTFHLLNKERFVEFAAQNKLPAVYDGREFALAGGLMSYTPNHLDLYKRAAIYVDKILKGANPANLPVEQTMRAEFIINLKTAKEIALRIPPEMLTLADQVIE